MCFPFKINNLGGSIHSLWFPLLFGSNVFSTQNQYLGGFPSLFMVLWVVWFPMMFGSNMFSTQNHHFGWFPSLFIVPSVVWLQSAVSSTGSEKMHFSWEHSYISHHFLCTSLCQKSKFPSKLLNFPRISLPDYPFFPTMLLKLLNCWILTVRSCLANIELGTGIFNHLGGKCLLFMHLFKSDSET